MSLQDLGNIGEFIGAVGVVASLIYLALQIRQNTKAVRRTAHISAVDAFNDFNSLVARDPGGATWPPIEGTPLRF